MSVMASALASVARRAWTALQRRRGDAVEVCIVPQHKITASQGDRGVERMLQARQARWRLRC